MVDSSVLQFPLSKAYQADNIIIANLETGRYAGHFVGFHGKKTGKKTGKIV